MIKPERETFDDPAAFLAAQRGGKKRQPAQEARPDIPRAPAGIGDQHNALMRLAALGFMPRWRAGAGHDFWHLDGRETSAHEDYAAAVKAAEEEAMP